MRKCLMAVILAVVAAVGFCEEAETIKVRGKGVGTDRMEALKDAYRDAIEQAVGLYVDAEQMVENEELVKDQILTQSNAYIEKYKIAKESKLEEGLVVITILADVRKLALTKRIKDVMPSQKVQLLEISRNLHAQIVTDFKRKSDSVALLKNELDNLMPVKQLMKVSFASEKPIVESLPEDANLVRLWYPIKVEVDRSRYCKEFVPRMIRVLDQIKIGPDKRIDMTNNLKYVKEYEAYIAEKFGTSRTGRTGIMTRSSEPRDDKDWCRVSDDVLRKYGLALNQEYKGVCFLDSLILGESHTIHGLTDLYMRSDSAGQYFYFPWRKAGLTLPFFIDFWCDPIFTMKEGKTLPEDCKFHVGIIDKSKGQMLSGRLFKIPYECVREITMWQEKTVGTWDIHKNREVTLQKTVYALSFGDGTGDEVAGCSFSIRNMDVINFTCNMLEDTKEENDNSRTGGSWLWNITPLVGGFAKSYVKWVSVDIPKDDVAKIASATISVEE